MQRILVFLMMGVGALAHPASLTDWTQLPDKLLGHELAFVTTDGVSLEGKLLQNGAAAFSVDVTSTTDKARFPKGKQNIGHESVAKVSGSIRRMPFRAFANPMVLMPLNNAVHANGLFTLLSDLDGSGSQPPIPLKVVDMVTIPFWLGWAGVGLAATPIVAPVSYLHGSDHYDFTVR